MQCGAWQAPVRNAQVPPRSALPSTPPARCSAAIDRCLPRQAHQVDHICSRAVPRTSPVWICEVGLRICSIRRVPLNSSNAFKSSTLGMRNAALSRVVRPCISWSDRCSGHSAAAFAKSTGRPGVCIVSAPSRTVFMARVHLSVSPPHVPNRHR